MPKEEEKYIKGSEFKKENKSTFLYIGGKNTNLGIQTLRGFMQIKKLDSIFYPYICNNSEYTHICEIEIPDNALIKISRYCTLSNNINIISKISFQDFFETLNDTEKIITLKTSEGDTFKFMNPNLMTDKIRMSAVRNKGDLILNMIDLPIKSLEKICIAAVKNNGENIQYIYNMISSKPSLSSILTENLKMLAVKQEPASIAHIKNPSEFLKIEAVSKKGDVISLIENPSEELKTAAIKAKTTPVKTKLGLLELRTELVEKDVELKIYETVYYFKDNLDEKSLMTLGTHRWGELIKYMKNISDDMLLKILKKDSNAMHGIENPSEDFLLKAITIRPGIISCHRNLSQEFYLKAVKINPLTIYRIDDPTVEMQMEAVKSNSECIRFINNPCDEVQIKAIKFHPNSIRFINNPCKEAQMEAIKIRKENIKHIKNPCEEALEYVKKNDFKN